MKTYQTLFRAYLEMAQTSIRKLILFLWNFLKKFLAYICTRNCSKDESVKLLHELNSTLVKIKTWYFLNTAAEGKTHFTNFLAFLSVHLKKCIKQFLDSFLLFVSWWGGELDFLPRRTWPKQAQFGGRGPFVRWPAGGCCGQATTWAWAAYPAQRRGHPHPRLNPPRLFASDG